MKILIVSSEMEPFAKTGGLADVIGALPKSLKDLGHDVRIIIPKYKAVDEKSLQLKLTKSGINVAIGDKMKTADVYETKIKGTEVTVYFVGNDEYFGRDGLYGENGLDYPDNAERFVFFNKAVLLFVKAIGWEPHVIHCNDWQTGLICAYLKTTHANDPFFRTVASIYTVHNMGYIGMFPGNLMPITGLGWENFTPDTLEFWGHMSFAKAGLVFADVISTVSPTYAKEIQTEEYGYGLNGLMKARSLDIYGILNGIDYDIWDPSKGKRISAKFSKTNLRGKATNKTALRKMTGLAAKKDVPIIGIVTRIAGQKGLDILADAFDKIMKLPVQFVMLGVGEKELEDKFKYFAEKYPDKVSVNIGFDSAEAPMIYAGADMFVMPSKYEPCGLGQMISFKYGTVPIVRSTGGLADTVKNIDPKTNEGNGFTYEEDNPEALFDTVKRAADYYKDKKKWNKVAKTVMEYDFSWEVAGEKYVSVYKKAIEKLRGKITPVKSKSSKMGIAAFL